MTIVMTTVTVSRPNNRALPREQVRDRIYAAAIAIFRQKGFDATTVDEIARAAKVAKGTVFNFFPTKGAILLRYYEEIDAKFGAAMVQMSPDDPKAALARFYGETETLLRKEGPLADAIFRQIALDPDLRDADADSGDKDRDVLVAYFRACKAIGTVAEKVEPVVAAHIVSDLWSATVQDWLRFGKRYSLKLRLAAKLEVLFNGLAPAARVLIAAFALVMAFLCAAPASHEAGASQMGVASMEGLYEDDRGAVAITPFGEFGDGVFFIDYAGGRVGPLLAKPDHIAIGIGMKDAKSEAGTVTRTSTGLRAEFDGTQRTLREVPLNRELFAITNGTVKLAGELVSRTNANSKGAAVIVHGSNDSPRTVYGPWVYYLVASGWAVAVYDKRGSGQSTGDWRTGDFTELASDARAVAAFTHGKPALSGKPVGMLGISQAGWVMPLAAEDGGFDFIVSLAGAGVMPAQQTLDLTRGQLEAYGFSQSEIDKALAYYRLDLDVSMGRKSWADVDAAYKKAMAAKAEWLLAPPEAADSQSRAYLGRIARFDPAPHWAKLHIPVLALFGGKDSIVPVDPNRALIEKMLAANGNPATKIVVIADVNHVGMIAKTGTFAEYPTLDHYDPAYFKTFGDWLDSIAVR